MNDFPLCSDCFLGLAALRGSHQYLLQASSKMLVRPSRQAHAPLKREREDSDVKYGVFIN